MLSIKMRMEHVERREKQLVLQEEKRVKQLRDDFYEKHPVPVEDCPICFESFPLITGSRITIPCCGACICITCGSSNKIKKCPFCRSEFFHIQNDADRLNHAQKLADMGKPLCQFNLGQAYIHENYGLKKSYEKAVYWYRRVADQGLCEAQYELAVFYIGGHHVPKCLVTAIELLEEAAYRDHIKSQQVLGMLYLKGGDGLPRDVNQAVYWFTVAASRSYEYNKKSLITNYDCSVSRFHLGVIYKKEPPFSNTDGSLELAKYWFQKAIDCNLSADAKIQNDRLLDKSKDIKGKSQRALTLTLTEIWEKNYKAFNVTGPVPFPQIIRLLHKAHENGEERSIEAIQHIQSYSKQFCSNCGKGASETRKMETCSSCEAASYCSRECQTEHYEPFHKAICKEEKDIS